MLAGIPNRCSDLTYCNVTDTCCIYEIKSATQPTCITLYVYNKEFLVIKRAISLKETFVLFC